METAVVADGSEKKKYDRIRGGTLNFGADGRSLCYCVNVGEEGDRGFLVIDGQERTTFDRIMPSPSETLYFGSGTYSYVAVKRGAYGWIEEKRHKN